MHRDQDPLLVAVAVLSPGLAMAAAHIFAKSHYNRAADPHAEACAALGVPPTVKVLSGPPSRLFGHMWVHSSNGHLVSNLISFVFTMAEFGDEAAPLDNLTKGTVFSGLKRSLSATVIMLFGSIAGGIPATILEYSRRTADLKQRHGLGVPILEKMIGKVSDMQKDWTIMCGASAGITALSGYNATYFRKYASGALCLVQVVLAASSDPAAADPSLFAFGSSRVGHAAHIGGFVAGAMLGYLHRRVEQTNMGGNGGAGGRRLGAR